jgi:hypothetical protein
MPKVKPSISLNILRLLPLLFITVGHVSSGISTIGFEDLVNWSDAILLVGKRTPYTIPFKTKYSDSIKEEFETTLYSFQIKSIVADSKDLMKGKERIDVHSDADADNFHDRKMQFEERGRRIRIHERYASKFKNVEQEKEFLIFIKYDEMKGWFCFTAGGAMESKQMIDSIRAITPRPARE